MALAIIFALYYFLQITGLKIIIAVAVALSAWELLGILFKSETSKLLKSSFFVLSFLVFLVSTMALNLGAIVYAMSLIALTIISLLKLHKSGDLQRMTKFQAHSALGLMYVGLLPSFAFRLLDQDFGLFWFIYLLAVVFAGDTMAYCFGVLFGKHKVMPTVSPKKTWEGSLGGILGSVVAGTICWKFLLTGYSGYFIVGLAAVSGYVAQFGDFFESLLKRVAEVKDSGKIMPGHGGVLDRIDGVLFASPVILLGVVILSHLLS
ncbi:phosphatidate cytidylyltransferase [Bdellovibrio sp. SKB1291214]|uniref:phosphatidate cytidylyltransferase n=1 Tax=Bdellovibrio sp. SKB1291214 TaxID=1732569 RepID=UPI00223EC47E|nr:phosphatidate cytidylyltransferase [Bdellovibrio sp. SKB1291214]UYL10657.1 phosphatidate cytidylyltransferase [Bdellovibrio sp. SKB1291214]